MKKFFSLAVGAAILFGAHAPLSAKWGLGHVGAAANAVYTNAVQCTAASVALYPFIEKYYEGVALPRYVFFTTNVPLAQYLSQLSLPELLEFLKNTGAPYAQHAAIMLAGGYATKFVVQQVLNSNN